MQEVGRFSRVRALDRIGLIRILEFTYESVIEWNTSEYTRYEISRLSSSYILIHRYIRNSWNNFDIPMIEYIS